MPQHFVIPSLERDQIAEIGDVLVGINAHLSFESV